MESGRGEISGSKYRKVEDARGKTGGMVEWNNRELMG